MLKSLALVCVVLSHVAIVSVLLPDHAPGPESKQAQSQDKRDPLAPSGPAQTQVHNNVTNNPEAQSASQNNLWIKGGVIVNALLVLVTIGIALSGRSQA